MARKSTINAAEEINLHFLAYYKMPCFLDLLRNLRVIFYNLSLFPEDQ